MKIPIAIIFLSALIACSPETPSNKLEERRSITYLLNSTTPFNGTSVEHHENGQLMAEIHYRNGAIVDGAVVSYHENGQLRERGNYLQGRKHGRFESYFGNGDLWLTTNYRNGEKHGIFETYHDGALMFRLCYQNNEEVYMPLCSK